MPYNVALDEHRVDKTDLSGEKIFLFPFKPSGLACTIIWMSPFSILQLLDGYQFYSS